MAKIIVEKPVEFNKIKTLLQKDLMYNIDYSKIGTGLKSYSSPEIIGSQIVADFKGWDKIESVDEMVADAVQATIAMRSSLWKY